MEKTECSETSAYKLQTPRNYPEENIQQIKPVYSLLSDFLRPIETLSSHMPRSITSISFRLPHQNPVCIYTLPIQATCSVYFNISDLSPS